LSTERTSQSVLRHVEAELLAGRLVLGGKLPAERALASQLGLSRPSVREAIRVLEALGVVRTGVGSGPDAGAVIVADASLGITAALRLHLASSHLPMSDVVQTRVLLESWTAREAAKRQDADALARAASLLTAMDRPKLPAAEFHALDADFHVTLAEASANQVVAAMMAALRESIHSYVLAAVPGLPDWAVTCRRLRRQHKAILRAVNAGDGDRAAALMIEHIEGFYQEAQLGG
jgi:GntR family transcriptional repressor for pyruvate dehydrogenase complex